LLQLLRSGDTLKITRLHRLSRSVLHLVALGAYLRERGIGPHVIGQGIDTFTMAGRAVFGMLSVLAELPASSSWPTRWTAWPPHVPGAVGAVDGQV
jgi:DNA invertase Pin-like site-specific DNA recombinase